MPCFNEQQSAAEVARLSAREKAGDELIDSYSLKYYAAPPAARAEIIGGFRELILFLQQNKLTRRTILSEGEEPTNGTEIWASDLTEDGKALMRAAHDRWNRALDRGAKPNDLKIFSKALAQLRKSPEAFLESRRGETRANQVPPRTKGVSRKRQSDRSLPRRRLGSSERREVEGSPLDPEVYDQAKWHYEGDYPAGLAHENAYVYTGMFLGWLMEHDMVIAEFLPETERFKRREITGAQAYELMGGTFASDMLKEEGIRVTRDYYCSRYASDYQRTLAHGLPSLYHVKDTWENYELMRERIEQDYRSRPNRGKGQNR